MAVQRIDKVLAAMGLCSRKEAVAYARKGAIAVDGVVCRDASRKIDPDQVCLTFNGQPVGYQEHVYLMLHKPLGVLSATEDRDQQTVLDLLPGVYRSRGVFPVGRLDKDTEGLLLLTNDGGLAHRLLSPKYHVDKVYYTRVAGCLTEEDRLAFRQGMVLGDGLHCLPAELEILSAGEESEAHVTLREGKFHQVKRMLAARGKPVLYLERVKMGNLTLDRDLPRGSFRFLRPEELESLQNF